MLVEAGLLSSGEGCPASQLALLGGAETDGRWVGELARSGPSTAPAARRARRALRFLPRRERERFTGFSAPTGSWGGGAGWTAGGFLRRLRRRRFFSGVMKAVGRVQ